MLSTDPVRLAWLAALLFSYFLACLAPYVRHRRKLAAALAARAALANSRPWIVAYASQTGNAEQLAGQTAATLALAGIPVRVSELAQLQAGDLQAAERVLFLASTYGEGDAPDNAAAFCGRVMGANLHLTHLHYAVLALGDSSYRQFCGFGRALDQWLAGRGAARLFERIEVDGGNPAALAQWRQQLSHLAGTSDAPDWGAPAFATWQLTARRLLNPLSAGAPVYHLELAPAQGALPQWQSGDLVQIAAPAEPDRPREYSIASIVEDERVHLLVRLHRHQDGSSGVVSGWLTQQCAIGDMVQLRLRAHKRFQLGDNAARPLILIGNGSGMAGLRGHLKARVQAGQGRNWLVFGERNAQHDYHYREDIDAWRDAGMLERLDMVFSRDQGQRIYVQDRVRAQAEAVRQWLSDGAAIYVCGSLEGMASGVDQALEAIVGRAALHQLSAEGRYRRDVY